MIEIPRWKVDAALRLLGLDPAEVWSEGNLYLVSIDPVGKRVVAHRTPESSDFSGITDAVEDNRLHLLAMLPDENWSELVTVDEDELKYFTGPKLVPGSLVKYPNGTMMLTVKRRPE